LACLTEADKIRNEVVRMDTEHNLAAMADDAFAAVTEHRQIQTFSSRAGGLSLDDAYRITSFLRAHFEARGDTIEGRKIGFTNRDMWRRYGVDSPIWGYTTSRTTHDLATTAAVRVGEFVEPRIEPEIMFGLRAEPLPDMTEMALLECIGWVALGFEVVQSIFPDWKFAAPDTVAANGLHGALFVGTRHEIASRRAAWVHELAAFTIDLYCDGTLSEQGSGALVLDSPLHALRHLAELTAHDPHNPPLQAGEIISTGTLTLAMPVAAGQRWTTKVAGIPLEEINLRFE
jgi:2-oxo-3-hexenedioate decarboxylase